MVVGGGVRKGGRWGDGWAMVRGKGGEGRKGRRLRGKEERERGGDNEKGRRERIGRR